MKLLRQSGLHQRQHQRQHRQHQHGVYSLLARSIVIGFIVPLKVAVGDSTAVHGAALEVHGETAQVKQVVGNVRQHARGHLLRSTPENSNALPRPHCFAMLQKQQI